MSLTTCQPKVLSTPDLRFLPACQCGWEATWPEDDRTSALLRAYRHDRETDQQ